MSALLVDNWLKGPVALPLHNQHFHPHKPAVKFATYLHMSLDVELLCRALLSPIREGSLQGTQQSLRRRGPTAR